MNFYLTPKHSDYSGLSPPNGVGSLAPGFRAKYLRRIASLILPPGTTTTRQVIKYL